METNKKKAIEMIVESCISSFALGLDKRYAEEVNDPTGVINKKKLIT